MLGVALPIQTKRMSIGNTTPTKIEKQRFFLAPPSKTKERKLPENCFRSYIDQVADGFYHASKLVRNTPRTNKDIYFTVRTRTTEVRSNRRNYSHRNVSLFRTKKEGSTRKNIEYMLCSFVELDGSTDNSIKTQRDVMTLIRENNLPTVPHVIQTSRGHFHVIWDYSRPLPFTSKLESYWLAQQKRLIQLFEQGGFLVDKGASMNPVQNLRNPSQLNAYNFKRNCKVYIHKSYQKTSLKAIYRALNKTSIANPRPIRASVKLRRFLRANRTFTMTHKELAITLGTSHSTAERIVKRAIQNGDMFAVEKVGNNKRITRATRYRSGLYIEAQFSEPSHSISKINSLPIEGLLRGFKQKGTQAGRRQKTIFALGLYLKAQLGKQASVGAIRDALKGGAMRCNVSIRELERTLRSVMKPIYDHPLSLSKLIAWDLIVEPKHFH